MKATRRKWKRSRGAAQVPVENSPVALTPLDPPLNESPEASGLRRASGGQNKGSKNDNPQNVETEDVSANTGEIPDCWHEMKAKLLQQQQERKQAKQKSLSTSSIEPMQDYWAKLYGR
jgi:hypothetical protein